MTKTISTSEAVRIFRCHPITILRLIAMQRVSAAKDADGRWRINRADLENWNRNRRKRPQWTPSVQEAGATA